MSSSSVETRANGSRAATTGTTRLTVAQALVRYLQVQHSSRDGQQQRLIPAMFGIFGHGNVAGLSQALVEHGAELPYYQPFNEQSMVHTAAGYAKATYRRSTLACSSSIGPGATNMVTGAALATINRLPVLLLPSDYYITRLQGPVLQQLEHPISLDESVNDCFRPVSRFFDRITRPVQLLDSLPEAMRVLTDPADTGAVTISLPQDLQAEAFDWPDRFFEPRVWEIERRPPTTSSIAGVIELLRGAERPLIIAGGGVQYSEAWDALAALAEQLGIPVCETSAGKGSFQGPAHLRLGGVGATGNPAAGQVASEADLVLCVGTRLTDFPTGSRSIFQHPEVRFAAINVDGRDAHKLRAHPVVADAREALAAIAAGAAQAGLRPHDDYVREVGHTLDTWRATLAEDVFQVERTPLTQAQLIGIVNANAKPGDTIVAAAGSPPGDLLNLWDASDGRKAHLEFGFSCMGYEIPASLGVRLAEPEGGEVITFIGDGTYMMNPTEIATAVQEGLKITVLISQNDGFQCIRDLQLRSSGKDFGNEFRHRSEANRLDGDYVQLDLAANAAAFGARAFTANTAEEVEQALADARAETRPCVIVVRTDRFARPPGSGVWWDVAPAEVSDDEATIAARETYEQGQRAQRYYG